MGYPVYEMPASTTLYHLFDSFDGGTGASITMSGFAVGDIQIYKNGSVTQRSSTSGFTLLDTDGIDFDTITGIHGFSIDLSDNTDAGFYAVGSWYHVVISSITIDGQTVNFVACAFRIKPAEAQTGYQLVDIGAISGDTTSADNLESYTDGTTPQPVNVTQISGDSVAADNAEADYDGTGYNKSNSTIGTCTTNTDMRGTDNAALASVLGALTDAAAAGDPTTADTVMQYVKQLINILIGTTGVTTFPAEAAPANNVSLAEVIRAIHADVTGLNGDSMRGTDSAALASVCTEARLAELDAGNVPTDLSNIETDTQDIQSRLPGALSGGNMKSDVLALNGQTASASNLEKSASTIIQGTVDTTVFTPTTTEFESDDITEATADHYNGRIIIFTSGVLLGQATDITDYSLVTGRAHFTVTALTEAPTNNMTFVVV